MYSPPIGLSVYEMYGRSESEQTLIGGDDGRESVCTDAVEWKDPSVWPLTAIVLPRCRRAVVADIGRLYEPNGRCAELIALGPAWDDGPLRLPAVVVLGMAPFEAPVLLGCDCSEPILI